MYHPHMVRYISSYLKTSSRLEVSSQDRRSAHFDSCLRGGVRGWNPLTGSIILLWGSLHLFWGKPTCWLNPKIWCKNPHSRIIDLHVRASVCMCAWACAGSEASCACECTHVDTCMCMLVGACTLIVHAEDNESQKSAHTYRHTPTWGPEFAASHTSSPSEAWWESVGCARFRTSWGEWLSVHALLGFMSL